MSSAQAFGVWAASACAVAAVLVRPWRIPEWVWAACGAVAVAVVLGFGPGAIATAVWRGADVYAFLIGILALAELGRAERVFDWLAVRLLRIAGSSKARLFGLVYIAGALVTVLLSNDTTIVLLTPAVLAAIKRIDAAPLPYLYACAFVANAASFVLPISNPANLVLFGRGLPALGPWLGAFGLSACAAVVLTWAVLRWRCAPDLRGELRFEDGAQPLQGSSLWAAALLSLAAFALVAAAALGVDVGYTALAMALVAYGTMAARSPQRSAAALRHVHWSIVPLVAALFVIVAGLDRTGAIDLVRTLLHRADALGAAGNLLAGFVMTVASNVMNNLPVALAAGVAVQSTHVAPHVNSAALVGIDLGPNLSVSGSLATLLWLAVLRREGIDVTPWQFFRVGAVVVLPASIAALLLVR